MNVPSKIVRRRFSTERSGAGESSVALEAIVDGRGVMEGSDGGVVGVATLQSREDDGVVTRKFFCES